MKEFQAWGLLRTEKYCSKESFVGKRYSTSFYMQRIWKQQDYEKWFGGDGRKTGEHNVAKDSKSTILVLLNEHADLLKGEYAFLQYMDRTTPQDGIDNELGCMSLWWSTIDKIDYSTWEHKNTKCFVGG